MSAFDKPIKISPVSNGGFIVILQPTDLGMMADPMRAFTNAADLLAWVTSELAPEDDNFGYRAPLPDNAVLVEPWKGPGGGLADVENVVRKMAAEKAITPTDPSTAPTVAPYEGCWAILRDGDVVGPLRILEPDYSHPFTDGVCAWAESGHFNAHSGSRSPRDIIAVHPSDPRITPETPSDDGWIEWKGGRKYQAPGEGAPVELGKRVDIVLRNANVVRSVLAENCVWGTRNSNADIMAYRLSRPSE